MKRIIILVFILFLLTACSSSKEIPENEEITLTISANYDSYGLKTIAQKYEQDNPNIKIFFSSSTDDTQYLKKIETSLMSGTADDILIMGQVDYYNFAKNNLLVDFYELMRSDSSFSEDDYFTNTFESLEYNGGLYVFPLNLAFSMVGVNRHISDELLDTYMKYDKVYYRGLLNMLNRFNSEGRYYLEPNFSPFNMLTNEWNSFVDREKAICDFNNQRFIDLLKDSLEATPPVKNSSGNWYHITSRSSSGFDLEYETEISKQYMFYMAFNSNLQYIIPQQEEKVYTHFLPLTTEDGKLIVSSTKLAMSGNSNHKEAAWEFIKYAIDAKEEYGFDTLMSIKKSIIQKTYSEEIRRILDQATSTEGDIVFITDKEYAHDVAIEKIMNIAAMPLSYQKTDINNDFMKILEPFRLGIMTAEQIASDLQSKTELQLKE